MKAPGVAVRASLRPFPVAAPPRRMFLTVLASMLVACGGSSPSEPDPQEAVFRILSSSASGETFDVLIRDPERIAEAEALVGRGNRKIVNGRLRRGDGGVNQPWSWHMEPESIEFADVTIEVCDGRPSDVEADLETWIDTVGRFCPWGSEVTARVR